MTPLLQPPATCQAVFPASPGGVLVDGRDYYRAVYQAASQAQRSIFIAAWQLDSQVPLLQDGDADQARYPVQLLPFLSALCEERPELEVHVLAWDWSSLFAFEREPWQARIFERAHPRVHFRLDAAHPLGGSHHQKLVVVDRSIAFVGGMDLCNSRWDTRGHLAVDPRRRGRLLSLYGPYHDVQAYVTGNAVDEVARWFVDRWRNATGEELAAPTLARTEIAVEPTFAIDAERVGLARTVPRMVAPPIDAVDELRALHLAAIVGAERSIYIENQYVSSEDVRRALLARLSEPGPPLEVVMILPSHTKAVKERVSLGVRQANILRELTAAAEAGGHRFGAYYTAAPAGDGTDGEVPVYIHAKVLAVDDRFLLVSSANLTNRSMGLDTEAGIAWESARPEPSIRAARIDLLREHTRMSAEDAEARLGPLEGLVDQLDAIAGHGEGRLRHHRMAEGAERGDLLGRLLPDDLLLDPDGPVIDDALYELTEGSPDSGLPARLAAAWHTLRDGLAGRRPEEAPTGEAAVEAEVEASGEGDAATRDRAAR